MIERFLRTFAKIFETHIGQDNYKDNYKDK